MFFHHDYLDLECNTWSSGGFWKPGQDGTVGEPSHQDVKSTLCQYNLVTLYLCSEILMQPFSDDHIPNSYNDTKINQ
jgi:hypothetical protein